MIAGLQHFSLSKGIAPKGIARASLKATSKGRVGSGLGWTQRMFSGDNSFVPPNWSRTDSVTVAVNAVWRVCPSQFKDYRKSRRGPRKNRPYQDNRDLTRSPTRKDSPAPATPRPKYIRP